jgi:putative oxidoreductase
MNSHPSSPPGSRVHAGRIFLRLLLGALFLWSGIAKLAHPAVFFSALLDYELPLPDALLRLVAIALPWLEALCGLALVLNCWPETVRPLVSALCAVFVLALGQALLRGLKIDCGCFGPSVDGWWDRPAFALLRTAGLLAASLWLLLPASRPQEPGETSAG